jgi:hypothetical protein
VLVLGLVRDQVNIMPFHIVAMGLKNNAKEYMKALEEAVSPQWLTGCS